MCAMAMIFENVNQFHFDAGIIEWMDHHFCYFNDDDDAPMCPKPIKFDNMAFKWSSAWLKQLYGMAIKIWMNEWTNTRTNINGEAYALAPDIEINYVLI